MTVTCAELFTEDVVLIDTRSPKEYATSHIAGAISVPLMNDAERHLVGLTFSSQGREVAIKKGFELFASKLQDFCAQILAHKDKKIIIYCARGGLRSRLAVEFFCDKEKIRQLIAEVGAAVNLNAFYAHLLTLENLDIHQLKGGYKAYRNFLLRRFEQFDYPFTLYVLHGLTAVGKSAVLEKLQQKGLPVIHLEALAQHKSSVFGGVGLLPVSQKMFDSSLLSVLERYKQEKVVFIEGEAKKIGDVQMPKALYKRMQEGMHILLTAPLQKRVARIVAEYFDTPEKIAQVREALPRLTKHLGAKKVAALTALVDAGAYAEVSSQLLVDHYDTVYACTVDKRDYSYTFTEYDVERIAALHKGL